MITVPTSPCAAGCVSLGRHVDDCPCSAPGHKPAHEDHCDGCASRPAEFGVLCRGCHRRLARTLTDAPDVVAHLRANVAPSWQQGDGGPVSGSREAPAPLSLDALDAADALQAAIASWVVEIIELHPPVPRVVEVTIPPWRPRQVLRQERLVPPARFDDVRWSRSYTLTDEDGQVHVQGGRPIGVHGDDALDQADVCADLCSWLRRLLAWIEAQPWSGDMARELDSMLTTSLYRWPLEPRGHRIEQVPCPSCEHLTLWWTPPAVYRASSSVQCEREDCLHVIPEVSWPLYARRIEEAKRIEQREARRAAVRAAREGELAAERERAAGDAPAAEVVEART